MLNLFYPSLLIALNVAPGFAVTLPQSQIDMGYQPAQPVEPVNAPKGASPQYPLTDLATLEHAFNHQVSNIQVLVFGRVVSILPDDRDGARHQRLIVELANSQTLLISHNIDIAPRIDDLQTGDQLYIHGEYEWNPQGGVIHWTHRDPAGNHVNGWIERRGIVFQ